MRIAIHHTTTYRFDIAPWHGLQRLRLRPKSTHGQRVIDWAMRVDGADIQADYDDHNSNHTTLIAFARGTHEVAIHCAGEVDTADCGGVIGVHSGFMPLQVFLEATPLTRPGQASRQLASRFTPRKADPIAMLHELSAGIRARVAYAPGHTDTTTDAETALMAGRGVCQDHAHIFITATRLLGLPARYVSGYLLMDDRIEQEAGHAWAEAHVPGLGWVGFDISNAISPDARYVRVATGLDYRDAAPVTGIALGHGAAELHVQLAVAQQ